MKKKVWQHIYNSVALFVYMTTHFSPRNRLIYRKKNEIGQKLYDVNVRAIMDVDKLVLFMNI